MAHLILVKLVFNMITIGSYPADWGEEDRWTEGQSPMGADCRWENNDDEERDDI